MDEQFKINIDNGKSLSSFTGKTYRITVLSDVLIRLEYNPDGIFNDYPTLFAINRKFNKTPELVVKQDEKFLNISNNYFLLEYSKEKPFEASKLVPDSNLRVTLKDTDKIWYFNNMEVRNYKGAFESFDASKTVNLSKGLYNTDGFVSFDDSERPVFVADGSIKKNPSSGTDIYLFIYKNDYEKALESYFTLTGYPTLVPRFALGVWWNKSEFYNEKDVLDIPSHFKKSNIPFSTVLLGDVYQKKGKNTPNFAFDNEKFPNVSDMINKLHAQNIYFGLNIKPSKGVNSLDRSYNDIKALLKSNKDNLPLNLYNTEVLNAFIRQEINFLESQGVDYFWYDDLISDKILEFMFIHYLFTNYQKNDNRRGLILARNAGIAAHRYPVCYSGKTQVSWKTLNELPFYNLTSANIGLTYWSHDIGGYQNGSEDAELYTRYVQLGVYSPIFRFSSKEGKYYKREPWKWDVKTEKIVKDYTRIRHRLIPYLYSEAYKYSKNGNPIIKPLYYKYPDVYFEPLYKNQYYFGSELFVSPITEAKDKLMNRVLKRIYLPEGIWYDFKTGKKFPGGKRYVTFYKDEDYPVYAKSGAIIPMAILDEEDLNNVKPPKKLEIQVFPGESNSYNLYEDDGITNLYKAGYYIVTNIDYNYRQNNYTLIIRPVEGKTGIIPEFRDYKIRFRNTKEAENVKVYLGTNEIGYTTRSDDTDFIIEVEHVPTHLQLTVNCFGQAIEIEASRIINEDIDSIINDLAIETNLKEKVAEALFSDKEIRKKRIDIRKLKAKGLNSLYIKMFIKLLEHISEV